MNAKWLMILIWCFVCALKTSAQQLIVEGRRVANEESTEVNAWTAVLDQEIGYCMRTYSDFIKEFFNTKVDKRGKTILVAEKTTFPELSRLRLDQRAIFSTESGGTAVSFTFSPGYDIHFGDEPYRNEFKKGENFVKSYVRYHYKFFYNEKIKSTQDKIKSKQNDIETNQKKTDRNNKAIADTKTGGESDKSKTKTEKLQREIQDYATDSSNKRTEIAALEDEMLKMTESLRKVEDFK